MPLSRDCTPSGHHRTGRHRTDHIVGLAITLGLWIVAGISAQEPRCEPLRLGLPYDAASEPVENEALRVLDEAWNPATICPRTVEIAFGSPYQLLEWFERGALEVALLQDAPVSVFLNDHPERPLREFTLSTGAARALSSRAPPVHWQINVPQTPKLEEFFESVKRQALFEAEQEPPQECRDTEDTLAHGRNEPGDGLNLVASWYLDPGYLVVLAEFKNWWTEKEPKKQPTDAAWRVLLRRTRFTGPRSAIAPTEEGASSESAEIQAVRIKDPIRRSLILHPAAAPLRFQESALVRKINPSTRRVRDFIKSPPKALESAFRVTPEFGVRTFAFTLTESLDLLRAEPSQNLALVLPGGGVKAAYQSRLVDELYGQKHLRNAGAPETNSETNPETNPETISQLTPASIPVETVVGTSGGALLGYFVARLGQEGPELAELLWKLPKTDRSCKAESAGDGSAEEKQPVEASEPRTVRSGDIFPGGDFLRYASVLVIFVILSIVLMLASLLPHRPFGPPDAQLSHHVGRARLTFGAAWFLLVIPLLVKAVHGAELAEQIPEIEGLIYALATFVAVSADQILTLPAKGNVLTQGKILPVPLRTWRIPALLLAVGAVVAGLPLLAAHLEWKLWFSDSVAFGPAALALYILFLAVGLWMIRTQVKIRGAQLPLALCLFVAAPASMILSSSLWVPYLDLLGEAAVVFLGFVLVALLLLARKLLPDQFDRPMDLAIGFGYLVLVSLVIISLTRPSEVCALAGHLTSPSALDLSNGALMVSLGSLLFFAGLIAWVPASDERYVIAEREHFFAGLAVAVGHVLAVYLVLIAWAVVGGVSNLEMTVDFWRRLIIVATGWALALVTIGAFWDKTYLRTGLRFLASAHPNGVLVNRRLLRIAGIALLALVWWNLTVAPAIYGNRKARAYLDDAIARFDALESGPETPRLWTKFLVPTNVLDSPEGEDGKGQGSDLGSDQGSDPASTFFFLFSPDSATSSPIDGSGVRWLSYGTDFTNPSTTDPKVLGDRELMEKVIMASGSPFPIFPATRVDNLPGEKKTYWMIDGGFSSLVPIDAALSVGAEQVLIVHSAHPLGHEQEDSSLGGWLKNVPGNLARNLKRLPAHVFGTSQRVDQISRRQALVVSLAPPRWRSPWPPLFDFRESTVNCLILWAKEDRTERIGLVESWGQPKFREKQTL